MTFSLQEKSDCDWRNDHTFFKLFQCCRVLMNQKTYVKCDFWLIPTAGDTYTCKSIPALEIINYFFCLPPLLCHPYVTTPWLPPLVWKSILPLSPQPPFLCSQCLRRPRMSSLCASLQQRLRWAGTSTALQTSLVTAFSTTCTSWQTWRTGCALRSAPTRSWR